MNFENKLVIMINKDIAIGFASNAAALFGDTLKVSQITKRFSLYK